jgi:hypothetical protein
MSTNRLGIDLLTNVSCAALALLENVKLVSKSAAILLTMVIADNVLVGMRSGRICGILQPKMGSRLIYAEGAEDKGILRKCNKAEGVTDEPMPKSVFVAVHKNGLINAGYPCRPSIHTIGRSLGKKVDGKTASPEALSPTIGPPLQWPVGRAPRTYVSSSVEERRCAVLLVLRLHSVYIPYNITNQRQ